MSLLPAPMCGRCARPGSTGCFTTGSTGEFYALGFEEFREVAWAFTEEAGPFGTLTRMGCGAPVTRQTTRQLEFAAECGASGGQVALPYWMELSDPDMLGSFRDLPAA